VGPEDLVGEVTGEIEKDGSVLVLRRSIKGAIAVSTEIEYM
jgi:hypothetical protein